jgi:Nucleotidyltransferase domain
MIEAARLRSILERHELLPPDPLAVLLVGSHARGWAHAGSDIDVIIVVEAPVADPRAGRIEVTLKPAQVQVIAVQDGDTRVEAKYWLADQMEQVLDKVSWHAFEHSITFNDQLDEQSKIMLDHISNGVPVLGAPWARAMAERIRSSALRAFLTESALTRCDEKCDSALGMLASGDTHSAALAAREAFGWAVDTILAGRGELNLHRKWRARRFRELAPASMTYDEYWRWETMRDLDPAAPEPWVRAVVRRCKDVWLDIDV